MKVNGCTCPGYILIYECTIVGEGATVWKGSAFDCHNARDSIHLSHSQLFSSKTCTGAAIKGQIIRVMDNCYTSQLNVNVSSDMIEKSIECVHDNDTQCLIGNISLSLTTGI